MRTIPTVICLASRATGGCRSFCRAHRLGLAPLILGTTLACSQPMSEPVSTPPPAPACFNIAMVRGYSPVGRNIVRLEVEPGQAFEVEISGPQCDTIDWTRQIAIQSPSSSFVCAGSAQGQGDLMFRDQFGPTETSCHIEAVRVAPAG